MKIVQSFAMPTFFPSLNNMSTRKELLQRYGSLPLDPRKATKKKKSKQIKNSTIKIIDDSIDLKYSEDDDDAPEIVEQVQYEQLFKKQDQSWNIIEPRIEQRAIISRPITSTTTNPSVDHRRPPSTSPRQDGSPRNRSLSPEPRQRNSPAHRRSPSLSPVRSSLSSDKMQSEKLNRRSITPEGKTKMSDGTVSGLQSGKEFRAQMEKRIAEKVKHPRKNQSTIHRDAKGRIIDREAEKEDKEREKERLLLHEREESKWNRGITQIKEEKEYSLLLEKEKGSSLAVYADDEERNAKLKEKVLWGDDMAAHVKSKSKKKKAIYQGSFPPNRFGIPPGLRWDGIDRSNGWEVKVFRAQNSLKLDQNEYHRWATEDM
jgi:pre-mRNA-splicing factor CWC26